MFDDGSSDGGSRTFSALVRKYAVPAAIGGMALLIGLAVLIGLVNRGAAPAPVAAPVPIQIPELPESPPSALPSPAPAGVAGRSGAVTAQGTAARIPAVAPLNAMTIEGGIETVEADSSGENNPATAQWAALATRSSDGLAAIDWARIVSEFSGVGRSTWLQVTREGLLRVETPGDYVVTMQERGNSRHGCLLAVGSRENVVLRREGTENAGVGRVGLDAGLHRVWFVCAAKARAQFSASAAATAPGAPAPVVLSLVQLVPAEGSSAADPALKAPKAEG